MQSLAEKHMIEYWKLHIRNTARLYVLYNVLLILPDSLFYQVA